MRISDWSSDVCSSDLRYLEGAMLTLEINPVTELLESCTQIGMIDRADDTVVAPQLVPMERLPFAVGHAGQIGHAGVDMSLRIEGPARVVLEWGIDKVTSLDRSEEGGGGKGVGRR